MKYPKKFRAMLIGASIVLTLGVTALAASYDSSEDPLISLSYLTNIFKPQIQEDYEKKIAELESRLSGLEQKPVETTAPVETEEPIINTMPPEEEPKTTPATYEVVELSYGDALYAASACDIMLRSGSAVCISPEPSQGLADYTDGYEVYNEQAIVKNHMLLIPRGDGRGIRATSESVFVMIRGDYSIVEG